MIKLKETLRKISEVIATLLLGFMLVDMILQVIFRYVFRSPLTWTEEMARYVYIWVTYIAGAYCAFEHMHVEMNIFLDFLPVKLRKALKALVYLFCAGCYAYIIPAGVQFAIRQHSIPWVTLPLKQSVLWTAIPLGSALLVIAFLLDVYEILKTWNDKPVEAEKTISDFSQMT